VVDSPPHQPQTFQKQTRFGNANAGTAKSLSAP